MRFPLRLSVNLALSLAARGVRPERYSPLFLNPTEGSSFDPEAAHRSRSSVVWIGGSEPLEHPDIARIASAYIAAGNHVFLETGGLLLRRRIHEFRPVSRLYLTFRFGGLDTSHDREAEREGAYQATMEAIRTARLCGFMLCARAIVHTGTMLADLVRLRKDLQKLSVDGFLISPAEPVLGVESLTVEARRRLLPKRWARLSDLLDSGLASRIRHTQAERSASCEKAERDECQESAQA